MGNVSNCHSGGSRPCVPVVLAASRYDMYPKDEPESPLVKAARTGDLAKVRQIVREPLRGCESCPCLLLLEVLRVCGA